MKKNYSYFLSTIFVLISFALILNNFAFAEEFNVSVPKGTSVPGCEEDNQCYIPNSIIVTVADTVIWTNDDTAAHTVTSGNSVDGPSGDFDSSLFMGGTTFSHKFESPGLYPYWCMVHPWMEGGVLVVSSTKTITPQGSLNEIKYRTAGATVNGMSVNKEVNSLVISISNNNDKGYLIVSLPRGLIDSKIDGMDKKYIVLANGIEIFPTEGTATNNLRQLLLQFENVDEIEIIGTELNLEEPEPICGPGTKLVNGICQTIKQPRENKPPVIIIADHPFEFTTDTEITFDASESYDPDGWITDYEWRFGNEEPIKGEIITRTFENPVGELKGTIRITDNDGAYVEEYTILTVWPEEVETPEPPPSGNTIWVFVGIAVAAAVGGAGFVISRSRKSPTPETIATTVSETSESEKGRECNVCGTTIPEGKNVCPNCGDTYS